MTLRRFRTLVSRLHRAEDGAALTEFTLFLPIWIVVFVGIVNLGAHGLHSTKVQLQAQRDLWQQAITVTGGFEGDHMSPLIAAPATSGGYFNVAGISGNDQPGNDTAEGTVTLVAMGAFGHYGESTEKSSIPMYPFVPSSVRGKFQPTEIMGMDDTNRYPHKLLNDTVGDRDIGNSTIGDIIATVIAASGLPHSLGAGIRYGSVFANKTETGTLFGGAASYSAGAHYDVLVAPRALAGVEAEMPFFIAYALFKTDDKYDEYQMFGKENWGGGHGAADTPDSSEWEDADDQADEDIDAQCNSICNSWDPDAENPGPQPEHWNTCGC